jgi:hypothetical protein
VPTAVATPERPAAGAAPSPAAEPGCAACPHPMDAHDAVGRRFCQATVASALDRGCVCRVG